MSTLDKSCNTLQDVAGYGPRLRLARLQELTRIPKPTLHRLLKTMLQHGLIQQEDIGTYSVGSHLFHLARHVYEQVSVPPAARQVMMDLQHHVGETIHISAFRGGRLVYVEKLEAPHPLQMISRIGKFQSLHSSAIGKAVLSVLPQPEAYRLLSRGELRRFAPNTIIDVGRLLDLLPIIRAQGYAIDDEEDEPGLRAIGCAICDRTGAPIGGLSIVAPSFQMSLGQAYGYAPLLTKAAAQIAELMQSPSPSSSSR